MCLQKQNGYTNEAFQLENVHVGEKGSSFGDNDKSKGKSDVQEKVPSESHSPVRTSFNNDDNHANDRFYRNAKPFSFALRRCESPSRTYRHYAIALANTVSDCKAFSI